MSIRVFKNEKGIGLVETIAALGIAVIVVTALVSMSVFTLRSSTQSKLQLQGAKQANLQLELLKSYRDEEDRTWNDFINELTVNNSCASVDSLTSYTDRCYAYIDAITGEVVIAEVDPLIPGLNCVADSYVDGNETPQLLCWSFEVGDEVNSGACAQGICYGTLTVDDSIVRVKIEAKWRIGSEVMYSYLYSDISDWREQ